MPRNFYLITPCGRSSDAALQTAQSAIAVAAAHPEVDFTHYLVFNNGVEPVHPDADSVANYRAVVAQLGDVGSRALARNVGIEAVAASDAHGVVCFMDAGDILLDHGALEAVFADLNETPTALWAFAARIVGDDVNATRRPRPLWLRNINNPFFIGATWITTDLAVATRFGEGAKEDWKYWLELLATNPSVELRREIAYEYRVVSTTDHLNRKSRLLRDQYRFFSEHLGYGHGLRTMGSMIAHIAIAGTSWLRRSNRYRPRFMRN